MRKRNLLWGLLGLSMVLASCQKQERAALAPNASLTVTIPQEAVQTRAAGDGSQVNRCILQVYRNGAEYGDQQVVAVNGSTATFTDLQLVASQTYQFVFWADCGTGSNNLEDNHYNTSDLTNITVNGDYIGNNEEFDAFFKCEELTVTDAFSHEVTLTRPFGQLNVKTTDLDASNGIADLTPTQVTVTFASVPTSFNALEGTAGDNDEVTYNASILDQTQVESGHLTIDYLWASDDQNNLIDFEMQFFNASLAEITTNDNFHNIPIRRNYQTTVSGNLLTKKGTLNVTIDPGFAQPDNTVDADAVVVTLAAAGSLSSYTEELKAAQSIRIVGPMNSQDLRTIQDILKPGEGGADAPLEVLDLSQATGLTSNVVISPDGSSSTYRNNTLKTIALPEGITSLSNWSFAGFCALTEINIPSTVRSIGNSSFRYCQNLETVTLPEGLTEIPLNCFWNANALKTINIPSTVTEIGYGAFAFTSLEGNLVLGENLTTIGGSAFYMCDLSSVDMSRTRITKLEGTNAFAGCSNLTNVILPPAITEIGTTAFLGCPIVTIDLPASVTKIAQNAFSWGSATTVICRAVTPPTLSGKISGSSEKTTLQVPEGTVDAYVASTNWNTTSFKEVVEISE